MAFKHRLWLLNANRPLRRYYSAPGDGKIPQAKQKYVPSTGTYPLGFWVASAHVGVKPSNTKFDDLALITSDIPCNAAGTFTRNVFKAAPVIVSKKRLAASAAGIHSVIVNSGCANAVTGKGGVEDAERMCAAVDAAIGASDSALGGSLVMSTGVIGQRLPINKILGQVSKAADTRGNSHEHWMGVARAICTTDTFPKLISKTFRLPGFSQEFSIAGMAKGAGMIHPNMGTLLSIVCTDAPIDGSSLQMAIRASVDMSFNSISIDGDTSTNDSLFCLANGAAAPNTPLISESSNREAFAAFQSELSSICAELAKLIVRDGEGATKFVTIKVTGARDSACGRAVAKMIAKSPLVKTALYGQDANWGRILCAVGYAPAENQHIIYDGDVIPEKTSVSFVDKAGQVLKLLVLGEPQTVDEAQASKMLAEEDLTIEVNLRPADEGGVSIDYWTCDFSHEYVTINGDYRT